MRKASLPVAGQGVLTRELIMDKKKIEATAIDTDRRDFVAGTASLIAGMMASGAASAAESSVQPLAAPATQKNTVLVTGASRGLGFEFTRQYSQLGWRIIATCRNPGNAEQLNALAAENSDIRVERIDVVDHQSIDDLAVKYQNMPIDVLLNNAGIGGGPENQLFGRLDYEVFYEVLAVNCVGPMKMAESFLDHVKAGTQKKIITVSSSQGSISQVSMPMLYWYRSSKSALNMLMTNLALQLKRRKVIVGLVTPGATATDFISPEFRKRIPGIREPAVAAADMMRNIDKFTLENTGTFFNYDGDIMPW
ncbi:MAG: SDR family oxidoreductase [Gammaproteobacteria bacterium]|nr:SDR family oxidoreductase [Gammaproteobacteria bacterium]